MDGHLSCFQYHIMWFTETIDGIDGLIQDIVLRRVTLAIGKMTVDMTARDETHAGVFAIGIVDGEPHSDGSRRRNGPVAGILMP